MVTLAEKIKNEEIKLEKLIKKRDDLNKKIEMTQTQLDKYKLILNNNRYAAIEETAQSMGVSVEDIIEALQSGDMLSLQERIEALRGSKS